MPPSRGHLELVDQLDDAIWFHAGFEIGRVSIEIPITNSDHGFFERAIRQPGGEGFGG